MKNTIQKNPRVRKIRVRNNSGAGNGCANFMDTWKNCLLSAGKLMSIKFLVLGGGILGLGFFFWGGGESLCRFYFYGREDFLNNKRNDSPLFRGSHYFLWFWL